MPTSRFELSATAWTSVSDGPCALQLLSIYPALFVVGSAAPSGLNAPAQVMSYDGLRSTEAGAPGQGVWARSLSAANPAVIAVSRRPAPADGLVAGVVVEQSLVALAANADTLVLSARAGRRLLGLVNTGTGLAHIAFGGPAALGQGWPLGAAPAVGDQGGALYQDGLAVSGQAVRAISAAGTTLAVMEG